MPEEVQYMKRDDDVIKVSLRQVEVFAKAGYEKCDPPAPTVVEAPAKPEPGKLVLAPGQKILSKDGKNCICDSSQESALLADGWSQPEGEAPVEVEDPAEEEPANDGSNDHGEFEHDGDALDQEQRDGEDGGDLDSDSDRL